MATERLRPVHPGDIWLHDFMQPLRLSSYKLAKELCVAAPTVNEIVRRRRAVTAEMALRLSRYFGRLHSCGRTCRRNTISKLRVVRLGKKWRGPFQPLPRPDLSGSPVSS
jgi:addiction module HigA family antidote